MVVVVAGPRNQRSTDAFRHRSCGCLPATGCADRQCVSDPLQISVDHKRIVPEIWGKQLGWRAYYQSPDADL